MTSPAALRNLVRDFRTGHPDATPDALASRLEDAAQTLEYYQERFTVLGPEAWDEFCKAMNMPTEPVEALTKLLRDS